jgi:Na+/H+-dicarboxylate symporter
MFCFVFGGILAKMDKNAELLIKIIEIINEASVKMIQLVMMYLNISIIINLDLIFKFIISLDSHQSVFFH